MVDATSAPTAVDTTADIPNRHKLLSVYIPASWLMQENKATATTIQMTILENAFRSAVVSWERDNPPDVILALEAP
ncbi:hypothetical protein GCM10029964_091720 [Kibdelosporangium lantanae]